ncbi:MAG TPA: hypothetical protein VKQ36_10665, partial [Ktedonobacterales bacterium]|nr:hypothetical protein [Ktedonobacterales bacterium]
MATGSKHLIQTADKPTNHEHARQSSPRGRGIGQQPLIFLARRRSRETLVSLWAWLRADWRGARYSLFGAALTLLTILVVVVYYMHTPAVMDDPDTPAYLAVAHRIMTRGQLVDDARLPGYPLLLALVFTLAGRDNLVAAGAAQAALFVLATLEVYAIMCLIARRAWLAFGVALLVGTNLRILSYVKPILSEGLTLFLTASLALTIVIYLQRPSPRRLWLVAACTVALFMTRPEWMYLPIPLGIFLLLAAWRRGLARQLAPHALGGVVAVYAVLGLYILGNTVINGYTGVTYIQNINLLGKVMEYHMQNEAPPQYAPITRLIDQHQAQHDNDPWHIIVANYPPLQRDRFALAGQYALAIIRRHPGEFLADSWTLGVHTLHTGYPFHKFTPGGSLAPALTWLDGFSMLTLDQMYWALTLAPLWWTLCVLGWLAARWGLVRRLVGQRQLAGLRSRVADFITPQRVIEVAEMMSVIALLAAYDWALTTMGGYVYFERLH